MATEPQLLSDGIIHDVVTSCTPTWDWYDRTRIQEEIDTIGLRSFIAECQHDVESDLSDLVLPEYVEAVHIVNWEDFNRVYGLHPDNRECPAHWQRYVGHDWGASEGHACCVLFFAVGSQNSAHPGVVFVEKMLSFGPGTLAGTVAHTVLNYVLRHSQADPRRFIELGLLDRAVGDPSDPLAKGARDKVLKELTELSRTYCMWHMGHDHKAVRDIYRMIYALPFQPCNPKRDGGVYQLRQHLRTASEVPHPFTPNANGLSRFYALCAPDQMQIPRDDDGLKLLRSQFPEWRWRPPTVTASGILDERPMKQFDDVGNACMMIFTHFSLAATPLTANERHVASIPEELRYNTLLANSPFEHGLTPEQELAHLLAIRRAKKSQQSNIQRFDDYGAPLRAR